MPRWEMAALALLPVLSVAPGRARPSRAVGPVRPDTIASKCRSPERRAFDFWVGRWTVTDTAGRVVGHSEITRVSGGCGILEHWMGEDGAGGMSLNAYDPTSGRWTQFWAGEGGLVLHLVGGRRGSSMVLSGRRTGPRGEVLDRITWTPLGNGEVRQRWETSLDGGSTWRTAFDGRYRRS